MGDPQTDVEARLRQVRDEIDAILDGEEAREVDGRTAGDLDDINGVVFGLAGNGLGDVRVTQEASEPPAALIVLLGEFIDGAASAWGHPPKAIAAHAIAVMEKSRGSEEYSRSGSVSMEEKDG